MNARHHTTGHLAVARGLGKVIVTVHGRLDRDAVPAVEETLVDLARNGGSDTIVVDLPDVSFLDGLGLGLLVNGSEMFGGQGRDFVLSDPTPSVRKALDRDPAAESLHITQPKNPAQTPAKTSTSSFERRSPATTAPRDDARDWR